jgi:hypothetical protein
MKISSSLRFTAAAALLGLFLSTAPAQFSVVDPSPPSTLPNGVLTLAGDLVDNIVVPRSGSSITVAPPTPPLNLGGFHIVIAPGATLAGNAAALAAFNRAAQSWEARISDPITITINADLASLGSGILGSTSIVGLHANYDTIRNQMVADASDEPDDAITLSLPTAAQFTTTRPTGVTYTGLVTGAKAALKAMGFAGLDASFGVSDASITFSTNFSFDFDHSNGVGPGLFDFETVAAHEIGHALGFSSVVDSINNGLTSFDPQLLDLYRFADNTAADPSNAAQFTTFARNFVPGTPAITDQITGAIPEWGMSTGTNTGLFPGTDGNQASHWKADDLTGNFIGLMDPTLAPGQFYGPQEADFRALDLIGYDIAPIPEFSAAGFGMCVALASLLARRRRVTCG